MGHDYTITIDGKKFSFQKLIVTLDIQDEIVHGRKLSCGGTPQVQMLQQILVNQGHTVTVHFNGNQIL